MDTVDLIGPWYGFSLIAFPGYLISIIAFLLLLVLVILYQRFRSKLELEFQKTRIPELDIFSILFFLNGVWLALTGSMLQGFAYVDYVKLWFYTLMIPGNLFMGASLVLSIYFISRFVNLFDILHKNKSNT